MTTIVFDRTATLAVGVVAAALAGVVAVGEPWAALAVLAIGLLLVVPLEWVFAVVVLGAAGQALSVDVAGTSIRLEQVAGVVLALRAFAMRSRSNLGAPEIALGVLFLVLVASSIVAAPQPASSLRATALLGFGALTYLGTATGFCTQDSVRRAARALLILGSASAVAGIVAVGAHLIFGTSWGITILDVPAGFPSATGLAFEHNLFGSMCAMVAIAFLALWRQGASWFTPRAALAGFWVASAGLVLSVTRGAWIGFVAGLVVMLIITRPAPSRSLIRVAVAGGLAVLLLLAGAFIAGRGPQAVTLGGEAFGAVGEQASRALEFGGSTGYLRAREWRVAIDETLASDPVFGRGTASYGQVHLEQTRLGPVPAFIGNWVVRTFHDGGAVALAALVLFFAAVAWPVRSVRVAQGEVADGVRALIAATGCAAVAYLATDGLFFVWPWLLLGLIRAGRIVLARSTND